MGTNKKAAERHSASQVQIEADKFFKSTEEPLFWVGGALSVVSFATVVALFHCFWGRNLLESHSWRSGWPLCAYLLSVVLHEGLHGLGYLAIGHAPSNDIHFGFRKWPWLHPYVLCTAPLTAVASQWSTLLPAIVLGLIPLGIGLLLGSERWSLWGAMNLAAAGGDMYLFWLKGKATT